MGFLHITGLGKVHFHEYGTGPRPMLAFHGYGMTGKQFHVLENSIMPHYHIYGFDHFFHGGSALDGWTEQQILAGMDKKMVKCYVEEWFKLYGEQRFSVMGYSIGANLALILIEEYAHLIDDVILMAPDGLSFYKAFKFFMHSTTGKFIFGRTTKNNWLAPFILQTLKKIKLIDQSLYDIAYNEVDTPQKRFDTYYTLNLIRLLQPDVDKITALINQYKIRCTLIFGKKDHLFPKSGGTQFINKLNNAEVYEADLGHWLVTKDLDEYLVSNNYDANKQK